MRSFILPAALISLSACSAGSSATYVPPSASATPSAQPTGTFRAPTVDRAGLDGIIGAPASRLLSRLGKARIDLSEGDSRKLQFAGTSCVLDIYLYPLTAGAEPVATHIEARQRSGGAAIDKGQCLGEVEAR
ncbi:hypothetical protein [Erythrobacter crassostreae]|uniref:Uncharacterized protein n=1 Tax=Erythrobacter crassostreae TaxID=2828328 RepID=A0A9X1F351_9SPHN|nr:hypothetical protein [Erythrobacter crassostrea]MBV7258628.1 hypothetical protein [Erythrobacter crassostrea]